MKRLTPQAKKKLSYERDRRNAYGESDKGSRKTIPLRKRLISRAYRRNTQQLLPKNELGIDDERLESADVNVAAVRRPGWRKYPDMPLGEWVVHQREKRERLSGRKTLSKAHRYAQDAISKLARDAATDGEVYLFVRHAKESDGGRDRHVVTVTLAHVPTMARAQATYAALAPATIREHLEGMLDAAARAFPELKTAIAAAKEVPAAFSPSSRP